MTKSKEKVKFLFENEEKILCYHGPLIYEAKVLTADVYENKEGYEDGNYYLVHYKGWKNKALKYNEKNLSKQKELKHQHLKTKSTENRKSTGGSTGSRRPSNPKDEVFMKSPEVKIEIPEAFKLQLVDEWESITKNQKLLNLPTEPTVASIIDQFRLQQVPNVVEPDSPEEEELIEFLKGLQTYFDKSLATLLLYRFERLQYAEIHKKFNEKAPSTIYGAEHLLRLIVKMPLLLAHTSMEESDIKKVQNYLLDFVKFIYKNGKSWFNSDNYDYAPPEYISQSSAN